MDFQTNLIYEDNHVLVANKPAGISTQPHGVEQSFLEIAKKWIKLRCNKPGRVFLEPIHRLDKPVSGIVVFARTTKALTRLQACMRENAISKTYIALIEGNLPQEEGMLEHFLLHREYRACIVSSSHPGAKRACLQYRLISHQQAKTCVEILLHTGRYHQIRVQFAAIGCPIIGDHKYGSSSFWKEGAIALHHARISIPHPITRQELILQAPHSFYDTRTLRKSQ